MRFTRRTPCSLCFLTLLVTTLAGAAAPAEPPLAAAGLSEEELRERLSARTPADEVDDPDEEEAHYERLLTEISRRGGGSWEQFLSAELAADRDGPWAEDERRMDRRMGEKAPNDPRPVGLEMLTTLRRMQKKLDPVAVRIDPRLGVVVECVFPTRPEFPVALVNQDWEKQPVLFTFGGDYRSGRQERWRFDVRDERGRAIPVRERFGHGDLGGLYSVAALDFGERWETELAMSSFVPPLPPGRYTVQILYHNTLGIARMRDVDGLIMSESLPITLVVTPPKLDLTDEKRREIEGLVKELDGAGRLKVVAGTYGRWAYELVPPDSAQGKLLAIGFDAVPVLIDALDDKELSPRRRQVILSLLFSHTGVNDPTEESGVTGSYQRIDGPWVIMGGGGVNGIGFGGGGSGGGRIEPEKQAAFAKRWEPWKKWVRVEGTGRVD